ncbi:MAG: response regulator [Proteobacteria bacterium]|nr:response regulator [Pseudomonadota bacterium]
MTSREPPSHVRVLVVDDQENMRRILAAVLRAYGFQDIREASNGEEALKAINDFRPDIVVTDYAMPKLDGIALARIVRGEPDGRVAQVPIVMVSGHAHHGHVLAARDAGVNEFVAKPVTGRNLADRIRRIVVEDRVFVRTESYNGPCRRRHAMAYDGAERRLAPAYERKD